jgi:hypothetical protein
LLQVSNRPADKGSEGEILEKEGETMNFTITTAFGENRTVEADGFDTSEAGVVEFFISVGTHNRVVYTIQRGYVEEITWSK